MTVTIALVAGDPAGIGPELVAKVLAQPETVPDARVLLIAQRTSLDAGARAAGVALDLPALPVYEASRARAGVSRTRRKLAGRCRRAVDS